MAFSLDAWRAGQQPWTLEVGGRVYAAAPLSAPQVAAFLGELEGASPAAAERALRALLRAAFPRRVSFLWRGDPVRWLMALPLPGRQAVLRDFFDSQGIAAAAILGTIWPTRSPH